MIKVAFACSLLASLVGCVSVPSTVENDAALTFVELGGYRFHVRTVGDPSLPPLIVVHGGPGGDSRYLYPLDALSATHFVVYYDQRGTGLSPRVAKEALTLESNLDDLGLIVNHYRRGGQVKLIGHSWGAMLVLGFLGRHPETVSHAVAVEPGMLNATSAAEFVRQLKATQSLSDGLALLRYLLLTPLVVSRDGHERTDYVMTRLMNRAKPGGPYQCPGQSMPPDAFVRAGYAAFSHMLKPVLDNPARFSHDLTQNLSAYRSPLMLLSSGCSFIGYAYQRQWHMPLLPAQTMHVQAAGMGHNMLTLNPEWSVPTLQAFLAEPAHPLTVPPLPLHQATPLSY